VRRLQTDLKATAPARYYSVLVVSSSKLIPFKLSPFKLSPLIPLSLTLPSPAINIYEFLPTFPTGEACLRVAASAKAGDRGEVITYQPNANRTSGHNICQAV